MPNEEHPETVPVAGANDEPEGPDLSSLSVDARALLDSALELLRDYVPRPDLPIQGEGSGIPRLRFDRRHTLEVCRAVKDDERVGAKMLLCLSAVDYPERTISRDSGPGNGESPDVASEPAEGEGDEPGPVGVFEVFYVLQSLEPEGTLVLKTEAPYADPVVPSVARVWRAADWYEREAHDMFGIRFAGHPDLSPLLLYDGFEGYPGRKEFPFYEYREF